MELKPLNEIFGWIWPKRIIIPAFIMDFESPVTFHVTSESESSGAAAPPPAQAQDSGSH